MLATNGFITSFLALGLAGVLVNPQKSAAFRICTCKISDLNMYPQALPDS